MISMMRKDFRNNANLQSVILHFSQGHNFCSFDPRLVPEAVIESSIHGYLFNNSNGCATCNIPDGYITFYSPLAGYGGCVPAFTFAYGSAEIYTCSPASNFKLLFSMTVANFAKVAKSNGTTIICGGTNQAFSRL